MSYFNAKPEVADLVDLATTAVIDYRIHAYPFEETKSSRFILNLSTKAHYHLELRRDDGSGTLWLMFIDEEGTEIVRWSEQEIPGLRGLWEACRSHSYSSEVEEALEDLKGQFIKESAS